MVHSTKDSWQMFRRQQIRKTFSCLLSLFVFGLTVHIILPFSLPSEVKKEEKKTATAAVVQRMVKAANIQRFLLCFLLFLMLDATENTSKRLSTCFPSVSFLIQCAFGLSLC